MVSRAQQTRAELEAALAAPINLTDGTWEVVPPGRKVSIVHSTRLPEEYSEALEAEAARRGVNPSKLMQILVIAALDEAAGGEDLVRIPRTRLIQALAKAVNEAA